MLRTHPKGKEVKYTMPTKTQKETSVAELREAFAKASVAVVADYRGLTVAEITDLRRRIQKAGGELTVAKNTLIKLVAKDQENWKELEQFLKGPTALAIGFDDPVTPMKALTDFAKEKRKVEVKIRGGVLEGKALDTAGVKDLANLPSKEQLLGRMLGSLQAPPQNLASVLSAVSRNLVYAIDAVRRQKEGA